jgi:hypothetical protein
LLYTFQGPIESVYNDLAALSKDVCYFYKLHVQSGGMHFNTSAIQVAAGQMSQTYQGRNTRQAVTRQNVPPFQPARPITQNANRRQHVGNPPFNNTDFVLPVGSTMTLTQFDNLPTSVCKGGSTWKMGRGRNFVCALCLTFGHTFEYCQTRNGFVDGGPPITTDPRSRHSGGTYVRIMIYPIFESIVSGQSMLSSFGEVNLMIRISLERSMKLLGSLTNLVRFTSIGPAIGRGNLGITMLNLLSLCSIDLPRLV